MAYWEDIEDLQNAIKEADANGQHDYADDLNCELEELYNAADED
jgi:hypothetical protein